MRLLAGTGIALVGLSLASSQLPAQQRVGYFFEAGGSGGFGSFNLELRPSQHLQLRGGAGFILLSPTLPVTASYSVSRENSSLEVGGGATVMFFPPADQSGSPAKQFAELAAFGKGIGTVVVPTAYLGYRYRQPSGFLFRAGLTPFFPHGHLAFWGGVSLGGAF